MGISASREVVYRTVTALAVMAGAIVSCEHVVRWFRPEATRAAILGRIERERYRWKQPDVDFHHVGNGIYSLRFPSPEDGPQHRVMIVGDSFAMGHGVGEEARFGALLERSLGDTISVDVLATSSYSPVIYRNIVDRALDTARYAAVAVFVDQTDPADDPDRFSSRQPPLRVCRTVPGQVGVGAVFRTRTRARGDGVDGTPDHAPHGRDRRAV